MKKRVLFINFNDHKSIISSGSLISRIANDEKTFSISLLIFEEYRSSALALNNIEEIMTIDRDSIRSLFNSRIYPKHFSLNLFLDKIECINNGDFDLIVNYSGDTVANYLSGYLASNVEVCGSYYSYKNNLCHTNEWSIVNDIVEEVDYLSFDRNEIYGKMMDLGESKGSCSYLVREKHEKTVEHSLNKLGALNRNGGEQPKFVGVCIESGKKSKSIPVRIIMDLLREMRERKGLLPLVITGVDDEDECVAKTINERFGHSLTLVKMDIVAAPSLIKGLDALICTDTYFKYLADLVGTSVVELSFGDTALYGGPGCLIMAAISDNRRVYKEKEGISSTKEKKYIKSSSIVKALEYVLHQDSNKLNIGSDVAVYGREGTKNEFFCEKIDEDKEGEISIHRIMVRNTIMLRFYPSADFDKKFDYMASHNSRKSLNRWINSERSMVTSLMKDILSTIRLVLQSQKDKSKALELAHKFDSLFSYEKVESPVRIPIIFFRGVGFSMDNVDFVLKELYKTKNHVQKYSLLIEDLDAYQRKERLAVKPEKVLGIENG